MPDKLTDNEVKKALEICVSEHLGCEDGCPLDGMNCGNEIPKLALDLINRQEAEKESLKAEVERLKEQNTIVKDGFIELQKLHSEIKAEAYKECIEKVKENSNKMELVCSGALVRTDYTITKKSLDSLLNEFERKENTTYDD